MYYVLKFLCVIRDIHDVSVINLDLNGCQAVFLLFFLLAVFFFAVSSITLVLNLWGKCLKKKTH